MAVERRHAYESGSRLPQRRVEHRPQVNNPAEEKEPQHSGEDELKDRDQPTLEQLTKAGNKETTECGDDVSAEPGLTRWLLVV